MTRGFFSKSALALALACSVAVAALSSPIGGAAAGPTFTLANVGAYGGEPSITSDNNGILYYTSPSTVHVYRSADKGVTWGPTANGMQPDPTASSGDDCLATDESNSLYWCNLNGPDDMLPLQADVFKDASNLSAIHTPEICTTSCSWARGLCKVPAGMPLVNCVGGSTSGSAFGVDRQWTAASLLNTGNTSTAEVVLMYHDFYGPSEIWVNVSTDGGATFGTPTPVIATGLGLGNVVAQGYQMCNTVPTGIGIVPQKLPNGSPNPHAGRVYVSWIAADASSVPTGCNISMAQSFHTIWVAYSDNASSATPTWTPQQMVDQGVGHDASTPFAAFALDNNGNPYVAFASPAPGESFATCAGESATGTPQPLQSDPTCDYHMWVVACEPGGTAPPVGSGLQCGDGTGTIPSSAGAAHEVDAGMTTKGTDVFPTIAVGDPGKVDVSWLNTNAIVPTDALGKFAIGGCSGSPFPPGAYMNPPAACPWYLMQSQSLDFSITSAAGTWSPPSSPTPTPMHVGDICNLGIACADTSNRNLLDFNQETVDPTDGCAHISFPDDNTVNMLRVANQDSGPSVISGLTCGLGVATPEVPFVSLIVLGGGAAAAAVGLARRRRPATLAA